MELKSFIKYRYSLIEQKTSELTAVLLSGKLVSVMDYYEKDTSLSPDGFPLIQERENIRGFLAKQVNY